MTKNRTVFRITVPADDVDAFIVECGAAEWYVIDTGERIMTDEGPDAEAVLLVEPVGRATTRAAVPMAQ